MTPTIQISPTTTAQAAKIDEQPMHPSPKPRFSFEQAITLLAARCSNKETLLSPHSTPMPSPPPRPESPPLTPKAQEVSGLAQALLAVKGEQAQ